MLDRIARGLGIAAYDQGGVYGPNRDSVSGWGRTLGSIQMVPTRGVEVYATYRQIYLTNPWVKAAVDKIALDVSRLPLHVYEISQVAGKTRKARVRGDVGLTPGRLTGGQQLDQLLSGRKFGGRSRNAMLGSTVKERLYGGNALWEILRGFAGVQGFRRIRWRDVLRVEEDADGNALYYTVQPRNDYGVQGRVRNILAGDVIHFGYGSDPESCYGVSPLESCKYTIALYDAIARSLRGYFGNAMQTQGYISIDDLTSKKAKEIREIMAELYATPENAGKTAILTGKWEKMGGSPDASLIDLVKLSREEIAAVFAVPPPVLGILDQAIKSNVRELREQYARDALGPWASDFEAELMAQLLTQQPSWSSLFVEFEFGDLLRPDMEARSLVYSRASHLSVDEIRGFENMEPFDIAGVTDVPLINRNSVPTGSKADLQPKPATPPPPVPGA